MSRKGGVQDPDWAPRPWFANLGPSMQAYLTEKLAREAREREADDE